MFIIDFFLKPRHINLNDVIAIVSVVGRAEYDTDVSQEDSVKQIISLAEHFLSLVIALICESSQFVYLVFWHSLFQHNFYIKPYVPREPRRDPSNCRLYEHGICMYPTLPGLELATCSIHLIARFV